jgi:hypothetical protein
MSLSEIVSKYAPLLGSVIGGPAGGAIGALVAAQFGADPKDADDLVKRIEGDPEAANKLMQMQMTYWIDLEKLANDDRANARNREIQVRDKLPAILAIGSLIIYAVVQLYAMYHPGEQDDLISARVQDIMMLIVAYYFGSSAGSANKDKMLLDKKP